MPRHVGPERTYFGGENGCITEEIGGVTRHFWRCTFCNFEVGGKAFSNVKARIHLSGDISLKTGLVSSLCSKAPAAIKEQFVVLEKAKRLERKAKQASRKRGSELLHVSPAVQAANKNKRCRQSKLEFDKSMLTDEQVHDAWGRAFFGLDIAGNKISDPLFREAIAATRNTRNGFVLIIVALIIVTLIIVGHVNYCCCLADTNF